jgi:glutamate formiminotransferase/formiminotetrahydrofolate cyclodeaminase
MGRSTGVPESDVVHAASRSLGLNEVAPFRPEEKVIEYILARQRPLAGLSLQEFADETSRDSAAPGGGSVAALTGAVAAALAAMVANLAHPKSEYESVREDLEILAVRAQQLKQQMLDAIDDDTWAFEALMAANKVTGAERDTAVREATLGAARVPLTVVEACPEIVGLCARAAEIGFAASVSDAGVGAAMARACATGAALNVQINLRDMAEDRQAREMLDRAQVALTETHNRADRLVGEIWQRLGGTSGQ